MFRLCFVWVYIIKGFLPLCLACKHRQALFGVHFYACGRLFSRLPEVVFCKAKQNGLFRVLLSYNFLRQCAVLSFLLAEGLERLTNFSSRRANVEKRGLAIGLFCGTNF